MNKDKVVRISIISIFVALYAIASIVSTIHVIDFFALTNPRWLAISLAVAFEIGAMASLAAIIILDKTSRTLVWFLFILLTLMQMMGNAYYAYDNAKDYESWMELFALNEEEPIYQKRILAIISGAILPIVALGFIKSLIDYIRPAQKESNLVIENEGKVGLDESQPTAKLEVVEPESKTVANEILEVQEMEKPDGTAIKSSLDYLDEEAIYNEVMNAPQAESDSIESVKNDNISDTIEEVAELSKTDEDIKLDVPFEDAKLQAIKEVRNEEESKVAEIKKPRTHVVEEPGTGGVSRNFGPPDINNGVIQ